jgi:hypothetical protein
MRPNARANAPSTSPRPQMMLPTLDRAMDDAAFKRDRL